MARKEDQDQEKDFLDISLDDALDDVGSIAEDAAQTGGVAAARLPEKLGGGILLFDNKKYAVGLNWLVAESDGDTELALMRAKSFKADFYCMRQNVVSQHGFGYLESGHRIGLPALASVAADMLVGDWHGVFTADNGWWYVAVHADNISPEGDILFASEEQAYNHFIARGESYRWPRAYAPESWNIHEAAGEISIAKLIGTAAPPTLKPVTLDAVFSGKRNKNLAIGAGVVIFALLIVSLLGQQLLPSFVPTQAELPVPDIEVSDNLQAPPKEPTIENKNEAESLTSLSLTPPSLFIADCLKGFSDIGIALPGWQMGKIRCKDTFVEGTWTRVIGSFEMVQPYLVRFPEGSARNFVDGSSLVITRRLKTAEKPATNSAALLEAPEAIERLNKRFGSLGDLKSDKITPVAVNDLLQGVDMMQQASFTSMGQNKPDLKPLTANDLPYIAISLKTKTPPNMLAKYFDLPGVIIQTIEGQIISGNWQYDAKLILKPSARIIEANAKAKAMQIHQE